MLHQEKGCTSQLATSNPGQLPTDEQTSYSWVPFRSEPGVWNAQSGAMGLSTNQGSQSLYWALNSATPWRELTFLGMRLCSQWKLTTNTSFFFSRRPINHSFLPCHLRPVGGRDPISHGRKLGRFRSGDLCRRLPRSGQHLRILHRQDRWPLRSPRKRSSQLLLVGSTELALIHADRFTQLIAAVHQPA